MKPNLNIDSESDYSLLVHTHFEWRQSSSTSEARVWQWMTTISRLLQTHIFYAASWE